MSEERFECKPVGMDYFETAPYVFRAEQIIRATPEQIFNAFEDADAWTRWAPPIQKVEWTSPKPFGLGTTRTVYMSGGMTGWETFIAWDYGKRMAFCFTHASMDATESFGEDYTVDDLGDGSCKVVWTMAMTPVGPSAKVFPLTKYVMALANKWMFSRFRKLVEREFTSA